jgi:multidrug efflux system outer membrane protein
VQAASTVNLIRALGGGWGDVAPQLTQPAVGQLAPAAPVQTVVARK